MSLMKGLKGMTALLLLALLPQAAFASPAMETIGLNQLKAEFNKAADSLRLVSILSPTCHLCQAGHGVIREIFSESTANKLMGFLVWLPMKGKDTPASASAQSTTWHDERVQLQGWDDGRAIGEQFAKTLKLRSTAWDVYLVYAPGVRWEGDIPPTPSFWMHQLRSESGADQKQCLNAGRLKAQVRKMLAER